MIILIVIRGCPAAVAQPCRGAVPGGRGRLQTTAGSYIYIYIYIHIYTYIHIMLDLSCLRTR